MAKRHWNYVPLRLTFWRVLACCLGFTFATVVSAQESFETLTIHGNTFSNVTVISRTGTHLSFKHAHGFASVKLADLPARDQTKVGFTPPPPPKNFGDSIVDTAKAMIAWVHDPRLKTLAQEARAEYDRVLIENDKVIIYSVVGGVACIYLLFCMAVIKICRKTTVRPGLWAWLPGFQSISLLKAAGMSPWYFLLLLIPPINLMVMTVWCFRICRMRQKSSVLGFLLLVPVVNVFVLFYLALSSHQKVAPALRRAPGTVKLSF